MWPLTFVLDASRRPPNQSLEVSGLPDLHARERTDAWAWMAAGGRKPSTPITVGHHEARMGLDVYEVL